MVPPLIRSWLHSSWVELIVQCRVPGAMVQQMYRVFFLSGLNLPCFVSLKLWYPHSSGGGGNWPCYSCYNKVMYRVTRLAETVFTETQPLRMSVTSPVRGAPRGAPDVSSPGLRRQTLECREPLLSCLRSYLFLPLSCGLECSRLVLDVSSIPILRLGRGVAC